MRAVPAQSLGGGDLRIGFGCAGAWAKPWFSAKIAERLVGEAVDLGVRHFDTGAFYAGGEGERRLGAALTALKARDIFVGTKTGTRYDRYGRARKDFTAASIRADIAASLRRLGRNQLDLVYLHGPSSVQFDQGVETLSKLKENGDVARIGVCSVGAHLDHAVRSGAVDAIMGEYNLFSRRHGPVFADARRRGVGVVAIAVLGQALYDRQFFKFRGPEDAWRIARALVKNRRELRHARAARPILEAIDGWTPAQAALAFALENKDIDVAVMATTKPANLAANIDAARRALPPGILQAMDGLDASLAGA